MSAPSPPSFLLLPLLSLLAAARSSVAGTAGDGRGPLDGGYEPIKDVNEPHIKEIGRYAVSEYDRKSGQSLDFVRVVSGKQQVVAGMNYDIVIEARNGGGGALGKYEALVYERAWKHYRDLTSFKPRA